MTRPEGEQGPLSVQLRRLGLIVLHWPSISYASSASPELEEVLKRVHEFDWMVFASRQAVAIVVARLPHAPPGVSVCAVGPSTAEALRDAGWPVDMVPEDSSADGVVAAFATRHGAPGRVLYPASSRALPILADGLGRLGSKITQVEAYRTLPAQLDVAAVRRWIERRGVHAVTFVSPSAALELAHSLGRDDFDKLLRTAVPVAMGRTTAEALRGLGHTAVIAEQATLEALAAATFQSVQPGG